jgi:hypothetical protein
MQVSRTLSTVRLMVDQKSTLALRPKNHMC